MNAKQIETGNIDKNRGSDYSWLKNVPPSDVGFRSSLERADAPLVREVLNDLPKDAVGAKTRRKVLEARLRSLEKNREAKDLPPEKIKNASPEPEEIFSDDKIFNLHLSTIVPCPFEPQTRRRAKFKPDDIEDLANSIIKQGLFSPIVVRPSRRFVRTGNEVIYEIVFGERRYLAHEIKNLPTIKCFVRELSDAAVLEMQYQENHQRNDNDPLDDAFLFQYLKTHQNYTDDDLADHFAKTKREITEKLKLNDLIPEACAELSNGSLPLRHAYYLSKFPPSSQAEIVKTQLAYKYNDRDEKAVSYHEFKAEVEENIVRRLADAPFDVADERLHIKRLICPDCPERTGFETILFPDLAKDDSCLNAACFRLKTNTHLKLKREEIALKIPTVRPDDSVAERAAHVPLVTGKSYSDERAPFREKVLTNQRLMPKPECEFSELSLIAEGIGKGEEAYICREKGCPVHDLQITPVAEKPESESEAERLENEFNTRVLSAVRERIVTEAAASLDERQPFWMFEDLIQKLIAELWSLSANREFFSQTYKDFPDAPKASSEYWEIRRFVETLDKSQQSRILFLLTHTGENAMRYDDLNEERWLFNLAKNYTKLDYKELDAEIRLELAPEEFKPIANLHLQYVKNGRDVEIPLFWTAGTDAESFIESETDYQN